jgi:hypothetical protein
MVLWNKVGSFLNENLAIRTVSEILFKEKITPSKILAAKKIKK